MTEIDLKKVVHKNLLIVPSKSKSKSEVIQELGNLLVSKGYVSNAQEFIKDVYLRETEGVTGIGQGVAIPHGKSLSV
jgi:fructose PTS system EIIA component